MADIFISYARTDRGTIDKLAPLLEAAGHTVWWDRQIIGGSEFSKDIERELENAKVVIVAWSSAASQSPWVKDEAAVARDTAKLVPICLDAELPPMGFRQLHAIDFSNWKGAPDGNAVSDLMRAITATLTGSAPAPVSRTGNGKKPKQGKTFAVAGAIIAGLLLLLVWYSAERWFPGTLSPQVQTLKDGVKGASSEANIGEVPKIAVAAIKVGGDDSEMINLAAALSEDIASGLSRFSYLVVASEPLDGDLPGSGARFVLQGTLRKAGSTLRLTTQLIDTKSGSQVWGETFDRQFDASAVLEIQDDLVDHVVSSVADPYGALMRDLSADVALKSPEEMTPYETILRHFVYRQRIGPEDHLVTRNALERGVKLEPGNADIWAALAGIYNEEYKHGYNPLPGSLDRSLQAARRAVSLDPNNAYANFILSEVYYFRQDLGAFRASAERAIALNPRDSDSMAMIGIMMGYGGDWERSVELTTRAMTLNPNHPGWYRFNTFFNEYRQGHYKAALDIAERINMPDYFADAYARAIAHAELGQLEQANEALNEFKALLPGIDLAKFKKIHLDTWIYAQPDLVEKIIDGLRKAGLE